MVLGNSFFYHQVHVIVKFNMEGWFLTVKTERKIIKFWRIKSE